MNASRQYCRHYYFFFFMSHTKLLFLLAILFNYMSTMICPSHGMRNMIMEEKRVIKFRWSGRRYFILIKHLISIYLFSLFLFMNFYRIADFRVINFLLFTFIFKFTFFILFFCVRSIEIKIQFCFR